MERIYKSKIICILLIISFFSLQIKAQESFQWRGKNRDGIYSGQGLLQSWPENGPSLLWEILDAGKGYSSPVIVDNILYVTGLNEEGDKEIFSAYDQNGQKIYSKEYGSPWKQSYPEARTTPAVVKGKAYVISGSGEIVCFNAADGSIVWTVDGGTVFERKTGNWGTSECPLVFDNKVIYTPSGEQTTMVALNAETGQTVWKSPSLGDVGAYVSPILITYKGKRQIVGSTGINIFGVDPETGAIEWRFDEWKEPPRERPERREGAPNQGTERNNRPQRPQNEPPQGAQTGQPPRGQGAPPRGNIAPNSPLYKDGNLFFSHGYNIGSYMLKLNDDLKGVSLVWRNNDLDTHHGGYVLIDNTIYGSNWINNNQGNWVAVDWVSGETRYDNAWEGKGKGSIIASDGMLYCYDERRGTVGLVKPTTSKFDLVSEFRITKGEGPHWAHPVINNGILYIRHGNALMAYTIKK
jgi:outer membrane protein assembly factor BamB